jgi:four helix bundle protein
MSEKLEIRNQKSERKPVRSFEDLLVFQRAYVISIDVHRASLKLPKAEQFALEDIAEGFGKQRGSSAEFRRYLRIAIGSCDEMQVWARYAFDLGYVAKELSAAWRQEYVELAKMLRALSESWK